MARRWLTPPGPAPLNLTVAIPIPGDDKWRAPFFGALSLLCDPANWEAYGAGDVDLTVAYWQDLYWEITGLEFEP